MSHVSPSPKKGRCFRFPLRQTGKRGACRVAPGTRRSKTAQDHIAIKPSGERLLQQQYRRSDRVNSFSHSCSCECFTTAGGNSRVTNCALRAISQRPLSVNRTISQPFRHDIRSNNACAPASTFPRNPSRSQNPSLRPCVDSFSYSHRADRHPLPLQSQEKYLLDESNSIESATSVGKGESVHVFGKCLWNLEE